MFTGDAAYSFTINTDQTVTIDGCASSFDTYLRLYDSTGTVRPPTVSYRHAYRIFSRLFFSIDHVRMVSFRIESFWNSGMYDYLLHLVGKVDSFTVVEMFWYVPYQGMISGCDDCGGCSSRSKFSVSLLAVSEPSTNPNKPPIKTSP